VVLDSDLRVQTANRAFYSLFGTSREKTHRVPLCNLGDDDWRASDLWASLTAVLSHHSDFEQFEVRREFPALGARTVLLDACRLAHDGDVTILVAIQDITERKEAEESLRHLTAQFETLLDRAPLGVYLVDADMRIRQVNPTALPVFASISDPIGRDFSEVIHILWSRSYAAEIVARFRHTLETGESYVTSERVERRRDSGVTEYYEWRIERIPLPDGRYGVVCYFRDISEQVQARQRIQESGQRFRQLADAMPQMVWTARPDGFIDYYNERWYQFTGFSRDQYAQQSWASILHPDDVQRSVDTYFRCIRECVPYQIEYRFKDRMTGDYRWFMGRALPVRDEQGAVVKWFGTCTDIDDVKRAEEALQDADRRKDEFLALLAHELRNPLAPIRTGLELIRLAGDTPQSVRSVRSMMERQVSHMVRLIDDLLDVSRITSGKIVLQRAPTLLSELVQSAVEAQRGAIEAAEIDLTVDLPNRAYVIDVDPTRFVQILSNVLHNASKFTPAHGQIRCSVSALGAGGGSEVAITVSDTGIGISKDMLPRVFELFTQAEQATQRAHGGLGIGLALARRLIEMHGGEIAAHSDGLGKGTTVIIKMPVCLSVAPRQATPRIDVPDIASRVVIIDDNQDAANTMSMLVERLGGSARVAHDAASGFALVQEFQPDMVFLDIGMPGVDGYETCRRIRQRPPATHIVIVAITGWGQSQDKQRALDAGFDAHLTKPVDPAALAQVLAANSPRRSN
jgi:PAS domain S-box-containing protein